MKNNDNKPTFKLWEVIVITLVASLIMSLSTGYIVFRGKGKNYKTVTNSKYLNEFVSSYNNILNNYYDNVDESALIDAAINGMLKYLGDPYTTYLDENNTNILNDSLKGSYEGVGVEVATDEEKGILINRVFSDSPAEKAGLKAGDKIVKVDGTDLKDKTSQDVVEIIRNNKTNIINIEVVRDETNFAFTVEKISLNIPAISTQIFNENGKKIGYIFISKFSDTIFEQFNKELKELENSFIDSLIIDVRNNTGGYLSGATNIAELFLEKGKIIYSLENKVNKEDTKDETAEKRNYKIFVLINKGSASASEVLAGALKYSYGATLLGTKTYGKGKVQKTSKLNDGTMYKYTSAKWLLPNGECIDNVGIKPDIEVETSEDFIKMPIFDNDNVLKAAIYEISK